MGRNSDFEAFARLLTARLEEGLVLDNPMSGTSTIVSFTEEQIRYQRRNSRFTISLRELFLAYERYAGRTVSTSDLKRMNPEHYDPAHNGHSCHCTFFFILLKLAGVVPSIDGTGRRGNTFRVVLPKPDGIK